MMDGTAIDPSQSAQETTKAQAEVQVDPTVNYASYRTMFPHPQPDPYQRDR